MLQICVKCYNKYFFGIVQIVFFYSIYKLNCKWEVWKSLTSDKKAMKGIKEPLRRFDQTVKAGPLVPENFDIHMFKLMVYIWRYAFLFPFAFLYRAVSLRIQRFKMIRCLQTRQSTPSKLNIIGRLNLIKPSKHRRPLTHILYLLLNWQIFYRWKYRISQKEVAVPAVAVNKAN